MAVVLALGVFGMPAAMVGAAGILGVVFGLSRIAWIIVASIFLYHVAVETGQFQVMKESIAALSSDKRLQLILIAFCFGAFLEGTGGGGAPVAIAGSFLIGLGFEPFQAATLCLLANTAPVAWGGVGTPIRVLAGVTGLPESALSAMTGRILPPISAILPLWLVRSMVDWRNSRGLAGPGCQRAVVRADAVLLVELPGVGTGRYCRSALFSLLVMVIFLKVWRPKTIMPVRDESAPRDEASDSALATATASRDRGRNHSAAAILKGWSPFLFASVLIFVWGRPTVSPWLATTALKQPMPLLDGKVLRVPPVVPQPTPEEAVADLNVLALPGTAVFLAQSWRP